MGMAFTDALIDHADVRVALVDRRHGVGGHWLEAYPFVRLHQASAFYGVASTLLGGGQLQQRGPEAGLQERAAQPEICAYYARTARPDGGVGQGRVLPQLRVRRRPHRSSRASRASGSRCPSGAGSSTPATSPPSIPAEKPPPFGVADGRPGAPGQRPRTTGGGAEPVRRRRVGQDRDRRLHLAARARRGPRRDLLGAAPRPVDAQPGAWSSPIPRSSSAWSPTRCRRPRRRPRSRTCSSGWRTPASCCASTARSCRRWPRRRPSATWELEQLRTIENVVRRGHIEHGRPRHARPSPTDRSPSPTTPSSCTARRTA